MGKGVQIGLSQVVYAKMLTDGLNVISGVGPGTATTATYATPKKLAGAISANVNPNASNDTIFADDGPYETASSIGAISLELNLADLDLETQADLLGHTLDENKALIRKSTDTPPWVAVGFKSLKSNGSYRYTWLYKGKFATPEQQNQTKGDSINWNSPTITGNFVKRELDDTWEAHIDDDTTGVATAAIDTFLDAVYTPDYVGV